jgi:hypothetical protein
MDPTTSDPSVEPRMHAEKEAFAQTSGSADVSVNPAASALQVKVANKKKNNSSVNIIMAMIIVTQVLFFAYLVISFEDSEPQWAPPPTFAVPEREPSDVLLIQTDESGDPVRHWEFKQVVFRRMEAIWLFEGEGGHRIVMSPMKSFVYLENPTKEERLQFLAVDKE